jgi:hypothetical protein
MMADKAWDDYTRAFREDALPKILSSTVYLSIYSGDGADFDVKQATELGAMLLLDRPLILVTVKGARLPTRLAKAADAIIEDWDPEDALSQDLLATAVIRLTHRAEAEGG